MIVNIDFDDQQLSVLAEIMGTVAMPMKITLPLMQHIEKRVNEQRGNMPIVNENKPKSNGAEANPGA